MENLLETRQLKKYFKTKGGMLHAVDDINFTLCKGKTLGVVGESGCGKSTLGRTVLRLLDVTGGQIFFEGHDITRYNQKQLRALRTEMQIIFQDPYSSLNPRMSVFDLIAEPLRVAKACKSRDELEERVFSLMKLAGLAERLSNNFPHELDGGRRQRIGVARALSLNPKFIVCDEPVSALDVSIQAQILNLLMDLQDSMDLTYLFITHDLSVVKHISDDIMVMYLGQCVERAESDALFKNPLHPYTQALLAAIPKPSLDKSNMLGGVIKGEITSPINPKPGCRFSPRCPRCIEKCRSETPELKKIDSTHFAACHRV